MNPKFLLEGKNIIPNKIKKGKIIYRLSCEINKILYGGYYEIKFPFDIKKYKIEENNIYKVYYSLLKKYS